MSNENLELDACRMVSKLLGAEIDDLKEQVLDLRNIVVNQAEEITRLRTLDKVMSFRENQYKIMKEFDVDTNYDRREEADAMNDKFRRGEL